MKRWGNDSTEKKSQTTSPGRSRIGIASVRSKGRRSPLSIPVEEVTPSCSTVHVRHVLWVLWPSITWSRITVVQTSSKGGERPGGEGKNLMDGRESRTAEVKTCEFSSIQTIQSGISTIKSTTEEDWLMNGKLLVVGIVLFFLLFFVYESWMMRGLPH